MSTRSLVNRWIVIALFSISFLLVWCTAMPDLNGGPPGWVKSVSSLCISVQQSYPTVYSGFSQPIGEELQAILKRIGVEASLDEGANCQATLSLQLEITPIAEQVMGEGNCYLDVEATGKATMSSQGQRTLEMPLRVAQSQDQGTLVIYSCPKTPAKGPIGRAWADALGDVLSAWWGSPALVSMLESEQNFVRWSGLRELKQLGAEATNAIPVLIEMLGDDQPDTRAAAAQSLGEFGEASAEAVPMLVKAIDERDMNTSISAIRALGQIGGDPALQALIHTLHHSDEYLRQQAGAALELMGPEAAPAIPDLIKAIDDEDDQVGYQAIDALGAIGPEAKPAIPKLIEMLESESDLFQYNAWRALIKITGQNFEKDANAWQQWWQAQP